MVPANHREKRHALAPQAPGLPPVKTTRSCRASLQAVVFYPLNPETPVRRPRQEMRRHTA